MTGPTVEQIEDLVGEKLDELVGQLEDELDAIGDAFTAKTREWVSAVVAGDLSLGEFKDLVEGEKALLEMSLLQKGVEAKAFANAIKSIILEKLLEVVEAVLR